MVRFGSRVRGVVVIRENRSTAVSPTSGRGRLRHQASRFFQNIEHRPRTENPVAFAFANFRQDDGAHDGVVGNLKPALGLARREKRIRAEELDELQGHT